jgi:hypothetical protein
LLLLFAEREPGYAISKTYAGAAATKNSLYLLDVTMPSAALVATIAGAVTSDVMPVASRPMARNIVAMPAAAAIDLDDIR